VFVCAYEASKFGEIIQKIRTWFRTRNARENKKEIHAYVHILSAGEMKKDEESAGKCKNKMLPTRATAHSIHTSPSLTPPSRSHLAINRQK